MTWRPTPIPPTPALPGPVVTVPFLGLQRLRTSTRRLRRIAIWGDSVSAGRNHVGAAGADCYPTALAQELTNLGIPVAGGFQPVWLPVAGAATAWTYAGANPVAADAALQLAPQSGNRVRQTNPKLTAVTQVLTWNRATSGLPAGDVLEFDIVWVDHTTGGAEFSYSINGGAWVGVPTARPATGALARHTVTVAGGTTVTTVAIRGGSAAGANAVVPCLIGLDVRTRLDGIMVDSLGLPGASWASAAGAGRPGDFGAWFDLMTPELVIVGFSNDIVPPADPLPEANIAATLATVAARLASSDVIAFQVPLQFSALGNRPPAKQRRVWALQEAQAKTSGWGVLDMGQRWPTFGINGADHAAAFASGLWQNEGTALFPAYIHPTRLGMVDIAHAVAITVLTA